MKACPLFVVLWVMAGLISAEGERPEGGALSGRRPRVIVSTDIGGSDPDDFQSMVHYLMYADVFDTEGLIASPPGRGRTPDILAVIDAYARDLPTLKKHGPRFPSSADLKAVTKQGALKAAPKKGYSQATEGSSWIVARAQEEDSRPLYILVWGSITDVAQAVHDAPAIKSRIRVYAIGSWNTRQDPAARDYLFKHHRDLWWIESDTTFRGMYVGGDQSGDLHNRSFLSQHVKGHGALGDFLVRKKGDIKMGDTPSVLYMLCGDPGDPSGPHWGGSYLKTDHGTHYWTDRPAAAFREGKRYPGAKTVNKWRVQYLRDWQKRMAWLR